MLTPNRARSATSLEQRLAQEARSWREQARQLPPSKEREALLRKARRADTAMHINEWLSSPGLKPPR